MIEDPITRKTASSLIERARLQELAWWKTASREVADCKGFVAGEMDGHLVEARRLGLTRLFVAMLREGLLSGNFDYSSGDRADFVIPLRISGKSLVAIAFEPACAVMSGCISRLEVQDSPPKEGRVLLQPAELLDLLQAEFYATDSADWSRFVDELTNGTLNEALCLYYRAQWNETIKHRAAADGKKTLWEWLNGFGASKNTALMLEQWAAVGHPLHIVPKTRLGLGPAEVLSLCPEFRPRTKVRLAALQQAKAHVETMMERDQALDWFERNFPQWLEHWRQCLLRIGRDPKDFVPLPVHAWQAERILPQHFSSQLTAGELLLLDGPELPCSPTLSVRTVVPLRSVTKPNIKLALGVRLTSVVRTISPRSCEMGPRISRLFEEILERDMELKHRLDTVAEELGIHYLPSSEEELDKAKHLGAILRRNPMQCINTQEVLVPVAALPVRSPVSGIPLILELAETDVPPTLEAACRQFRQYADILLHCVLRLYLVYGIALEAHPQNTFAVFSKGRRLKRFLVRDFAGLRIHEPTLQARGLMLQVHADRLTVTRDWRQVRRKLLHAIFQCHIGSLTLALSEELQVNEHLFWREVTAAVKAAFDSARGDVPPDLWEREYGALLERRWDGKASLRMRLLNRSDDCFVTVNNPLRAET